MDWKGGRPMRPASPSIPSVPLDSASRIAEPAPGVCAGEAVVREEWWWGVSSGWCGGRKGAEMLGYDRAPLEGGSRTRMKRTIVRSRVASGKRCPQSTSGSSGGYHDPDPKSAKNHLRRARRSQPPVAASSKPACGAGSSRAGVVPPRLQWRPTPRVGRSSPAATWCVRMAPLEGALEGATTNCSGPGLQKCAGDRRRGPRHEASQTVPIESFQNKAARAAGLLRRAPFSARAKVRTARTT